MPTPRFLPICSLIAVLIVTVSLAAAQEGSDRALARLEQLKRTLSKHQVWHADYTQKFTPAGTTMADEMAGEVWVSLPDLAHFRTGEPPTQLMGLEGRVVRLLDLEVPSCDDHVLSDEDWASIPLAAVLDPGSAVEHFTILEHGEHGIVLIPRAPGGVDRVEVIFNQEGLPDQVVVIDPQGATNHLVFTGWQSSTPPPEGAWLPIPPTDLDCITAE